LQNLEKSLNQKSMIKLFIFTKVQKKKKVQEWQKTSQMVKKKLYLFIINARKFGFSILEYWLWREEAV